VTSPTLRAVIVAHAGPLVRPFVITTSTFVVVAIPGHSAVSEGRINFPIADDNTRERQNRDSRDLSEIAVVDVSLAERFDCRDKGG